MKQINSFQMDPLIDSRPLFRVVQLNDSHAKKGSDDLAVLRELIAANEPMYPAIDSWFETKVLPGLRSSQRVAYVAYEADNPIASAILKLGARTKFCHLRIHRDFHDLDLGQMFFTQMTVEARPYAKDIYFTLPESLWYSKRHFFESFGFSSVTRAARQYRHGEEELVCSAPFASVWSATLQKLPKLLTKFQIGRYSLDRNLVMSVKPRYAEMLMSGSKLVEIRRRFSEKWAGYRVILYASHPLKALVGEATISSVVSGTPLDIWSKFEREIGCPWNEFTQYTSSAAEISAIEFTDIAPYTARVPLSEIPHSINEKLHPPQSYCHFRMDQDNAWGRAASLASLLGGGFGCLGGQSVSFAATRRPAGPFLNAQGAMKGAIPLSFVPETRLQPVKPCQQTPDPQLVSSAPAAEDLASARWRYQCSAFTFQSRVKMPPSLCDDDDLGDDFAVRMKYERPALEGRWG